MPVSQQGPTSGLQVNNQWQQDASPAKWENKFGLDSLLWGNSVYILLWTTDDCCDQHLLADVEISPQHYDKFNIDHTN